MYIIDKNKDFYDYVSHIYGVDKNITYDRRGSEVIDDNILVSISGCYLSGRRDAYEQYFFILETGNVQYLFEVSNMTIDRRGVVPFVEKASFELAKVYKENRNIFSRPVTIVGIDLDRRWLFSKRHTVTNIPTSLSELESALKLKRNENRRLGQIIPILSDTSLTRNLDPFEVWKDIQTYISSTGNDKDISIQMTEKQKVESHGFDENSFRNPIKL